MNPFSSKICSSWCHARRERWCLNQGIYLLMLLAVAPSTELKSILWPSNTNCTSNLCDIFFSNFPSQNQLISKQDLVELPKIACLMLKYEFSLRVNKMYWRWGFYLWSVIPIKSRQGSKQYWCKVQVNKWKVSDEF